MDAAPQFRFGVLVGGAILVGIITYLRFCGSLSLPPKPPQPTSTCMRASPLPYNAVVIGKGAAVTRTECIWRDGLSIVVTKTETMEILPLSGSYLTQVPPSLVGVEDRLARGHRGVSSKEP